MLQRIVLAMKGNTLTLIELILLFFLIFRMIRHFVFILAEVTPPPILVPINGSIPLFIIQILQ